MKITLIIRDDDFTSPIEVQTDDENLIAMIFRDCSCMQCFLAGFRTALSRLNEGVKLRKCK